MIIDTHTHVVSSDKRHHPLDPGARGWSTEVSNDVEDLIAEMDRAGVACATLVQPNGTYGLDNTYQCDSARQYAPRTVAVGILDPAAPNAADKLSYWVHEHDMRGVRLQSQAEADDPRCDALWQRAAALSAFPSPSAVAVSRRRWNGCGTSAPGTPRCSSLRTISRAGVAPPTRPP
jgi:predicted TIM-barrel fold metal-dependent hydrolase